MQCQSCSYEYHVSETNLASGAVKLGLAPFLKLEFDVSMKGEEVSNKSCYDFDKDHGARSDFVTLYACPKCGTVLERYPSPL